MQRYLDAIVTLRRTPQEHGWVSVMIPLPQDAPTSPVVLHDPLPGLPGTWHRESTPELRPARYIRVDSATVVPTS